MVNLLATVLTIFFVIEIVHAASERDLFSTYLHWVADNTPIEDPVLIALGTMYGVIIVVALLVIWASAKYRHETEQHRR